MTSLERRLTLEQRMAAPGPIVLDGAMGTELQRRGVPMDRVAWSAAALSTHPDTIRAIHQDNLAAGAEIIIANTFGASRHVLDPAGLGDAVGELNRLAVALAKQARETIQPENPVWVAGSISSFVAENDGDNIPDAQVMGANFREQADNLAEGGAELIMLEMMVEAEQSILAVEAAAATGLPVWVGFSCRMAEDGETVLMWDRQDAVRFGEVIGPVMAAGGAHGASLAGVMHSEMETALPALKVLGENWRGPMSAYAHSGRFVMPDWQFVEVISTDDFAEQAAGWVDAGARVVGGCCGIGPAHIEALADRLRGSANPPLPSGPS